MMVFSAGGVVLRRGAGLHPAGRVRGPRRAARLRARRRAQPMALRRLQRERE